MRKFYRTLPYLLILSVAAVYSADKDRGAAIDGHLADIGRGIASIFTNAIFSTGIRPGGAMNLATSLPAASNAAISNLQFSSISVSPTNVALGMVWAFQTGTNDTLDVYSKTNLTEAAWSHLAEVDVSLPDEAALAAIPLEWLGSPSSAFFRLGTRLDADGDGLPDAFELLASLTNPAEPDTDGDGMNDGWETAHAALGYDPLAADTNGLLAASADFDGDGLSNYDEQMIGSDPALADTDGDGVADGAEISQATLLSAAMRMGLPLLMSGLPPDPWLLIPELDFCTDQCGGDSPDFVPVGIFFGDPSISHSEKYALTISPVVGSGFGAPPPTISLLNGRYGVCDMALVFLKKGWHYTVTLSHRATNLQDGRDPDYALLGAAASSRVFLVDDDGLFGVSDVTNGSFTAEGKTADIYVLDDPSLAPDYDRDGQIDAGEQARAKQGSAFRFWINDDDDSGELTDTADDIPGSGPNAADGFVNGYADVVDFTPILLDFSKVFPRDSPASIRARVSWMLRSDAVGAVWSSLTAANAGSFHTEDRGGIFGTSLSQGVTNATVVSLSGGVPLPADFKGQMEQNGGQGVVLVEGRAAGEDVAFIGLVDNAEALTGGVHMVVSPVEDMYRWLNSRGLSGEAVEFASRTNSPANMPDEETSSRHLVFLHGVNVTQANARGWTAEIFKRMWQAGMTAKFTGVTWRSDIGTDMNYQENVSNAFFTASVLADQIATLPGDKVLMAHSLGNMVCSSMIQDYGLVPACYLMCNSAVPAEAYDTDQTLRVPQLVHPEWEEYPTNSWASSWHWLFRNEPDDDRRFLGWPGRFSNVSQYAVNFYSTGDEVLELATNNKVHSWTGISDSWGHYSWHKQELFKGRGGFGGTGWSGWNIDENIFGVNKISAVEAQAMTEADFKTNTVFYCYPPSMNQPTIPLLVRGAHLAQGIPALTPAAGRTTFGNDSLSEDMIDLDNPLKTPRPNGWPSNSRYLNRWLHSDIRAVAYYYNFQFYDKAVEKGNLK